MKNPIRTILSTLILTTALSAAVTASAATDGTLGSTSTGSVEISLTGVLVDRGNVQISNLQDFAFGNIEEGTIATPLTISNICVYVASAPSYAIDITSLNSPTPGAGQMQYRAGGSGANINYTWSYKEGVQTITGASGTGLVGSSVAACGSTSTSLTITPGNIPGSATFTDTLTLTVSPE